MRGFAGLLAMLVLAVLPVPPCRAQVADAPPDVLDEIVVTVERSGPEMWHIRRGDAQLWILGSLAPLPKGITWRSRQAEQVMQSANVVLLTKPLEISFAHAVWIFLTHHDLLVVNGGRKLKDVLPPDLYQRFATQRAKYTSENGKWERFRPIIAAAFLEETALHQSGLSSRIDLGAAVRSLADKHNVPIDEVKIAGVRDILETLKTVPAATENKCLAAALSTTESGLPRLALRASAWTRGDIDAMQQLPDSAEDVGCHAALVSDTGSADLLSQIEQAWLKAIDARVVGKQVVMAVVNIDLLLERGGLLDTLRDRGYSIEAP